MERTNTMDNFIKVSNEFLKRIIETVIFASTEPITISTIKEVLTKLKISKNSQENLELKFDDSLSAVESTINGIDERTIQKLIDEINDELVHTGRPYLIQKVAGGYTFVTCENFGKIISLLPNFRNQRKLTKSQLETLAIIAYNQPITKAEIEKIRGVNSSEIINSLLEKGLIEIVGRKETLGKPLLFGTTQEFLKIFGLNDLKELPKPEEITELTKSNQPELRIDLPNSSDKNV